MPERSEIVQALYRAVSQTNEALADSDKLACEETEQILGDGAKLDSLGFVSLMVAIETELEELAGSCPSLAEELSDPDVGVTTLGDLADWVAPKL